MGFLSIIRLIGRTAACCWFASTAWGASLDAGPRGHALLTEISAEPLSQALKEFVSQTGLQLAYLSTLADGRVSSLAPAGSAPAAALTALLAGTGLEFTLLNDHTIRLVEARTPPQLSQPPRTDEPLARPDPIAPPYLEEVLVTATKRPERLSTVPVSATVWSAEESGELGIKGIAEISALTPGVEYDFNAQWGAGVLTNVAIRGIDSKVGASTTGIYLDDAPIQARNGNFGNPYPVTFDLARVEVLRGPQSTLFGAGAEGGAIRFVANQPSTTTENSLYRAEVAGTKYGGLSYEAGAAAGAPLIEGLLGARLAVWYREDGGYVDRVDPLTGAPVDRNSNHAATEAVRLSVVVEPAEGLRVTPSVAYQSVRIADTPVIYGYLSDPSGGEFRNGKLLRQPAEDDFVFTALKLESRSGQTLLTATTAYFDRTAAATIDTTNEAGAVYFGGFGSPLGPAYPTSYADAVPTQMGLHQIVLSQEVRLMSADNAAPLKWTVGIFYSRSRQGEGADAYPIASPTDPAILSNDYFSDTQASGFGNLDLAVTPVIGATLGVRVDHIRSRFSQGAGGFLYAGLPSFSEGAMDATPVTPQFVIDYDGAGLGLVYAKISKGFRIGGINTAVPSQCGQGAIPSSFGSDSVWSYEIGTKHASSDDRWQLAASAFYLRWNGIQEHEVPACGFGFVANAGAAIGKGFDLSADALLLGDHLKAGIALEDVDVRYTATIMADGKLIVDRGAAVGGVPHVPSPWSGTAYLRGQWPITDRVQVYTRAEEIVHSHNPGPFSELDPRSISYSPQYVADPATYLLSLQAGLNWSHANVKLFVDNALNSLPLLQHNGDAAASTLTYAYTPRPRTVGIAGTWSF